jgi:integrase/recombinase XerD
VMALCQANAHMMIQRRAVAAGIETKISCHSFRATGITTYLQNGGKLEVAQQMAGHESARTTGLYDRRNDSVALDEVERIAYEVDRSAI